MDYRDYLHCEKCDCKLIYVYDGCDEVRDYIQETFNLPDDNWTSPLMCPKCMQELKNELYHLKKTCSLLTKLLLSPDTKREIVKIKRKITPVESPVPKCEVWIDGKLDKIYRGQDAIDVETGKIQIPKGAVIKTWDY